MPSLPPRPPSQPPRPQPLRTKRPMRQPCPAAVPQLLFLLLEPTAKGGAGGGSSCPSPSLARPSLLPLHLGPGAASGTGCQALPAPLGVSPGGEEVVARRGAREEAWLQPSSPLGLASEGAGRERKVIAARVGLSAHPSLPQAAVDHLLSGPGPVAGEKPLPAANMNDLLNTPPPPPTSAASRPPSPNLAPVCKKHFFL